MQAVNMFISAVQSDILTGRSMGINSVLESPLLRPQFLALPSSPLEVDA